jgi:hypothetical protein
MAWHAATRAAGPCGADTPTRRRQRPQHPGREPGLRHLRQAWRAADPFTEDQLWSTSFTPPARRRGAGTQFLYDALADADLTHAAHAISGADLVAPFYQCIAVSATADPVAGGWILYPIQLDDAQSPWFHDDARFGIWHDCLYMAANEVAAAAPQPFQGVLFASFSRADLYTSSPLHYAVGRIVNASDPYAMLPGNLTGQAAATIPPGTPNYYVAQSPTGRAGAEVHAGPELRRGGILGAPVNVNLASTTTIQGAQVPQPGTAVLLDAVGNVLMQKNQYRRIGAQESLWIAHTIRNGAAGNAGIQWAQIDVTGGVVATTPLQQHKHFPDATLYRWLPSLAADGQGQHGGGLQHLERIRAQLSVHRLRRPAGGRRAQCAAAVGGATVSRRRRADRKLQRRTLRPLGRLFGDERRPGRRLHVLVHQPVLRHAGGRQRTCRRCGARTSVRSGFPPARPRSARRTWRSPRPTARPA